MMDICVWNLQEMGKIFLHVRVIVLVMSSGMLTNGHLWELQ